MLVAIWYNFQCFLLIFIYTLADCQSYLYVSCLDCSFYRTCLLLLLHYWDYQIVVRFLAAKADDPAPLQPPASAQPAPVFTKPVAPVAAPRRRSPERQSAPPPAPREPSPPPVREPTPPPVREPTPPPVREPTPPPVREPTPPPVREPTPPPVRQPSPVREPTPPPIREPSPVREPTPPPVREPSPVREPTPPPVREPTPPPVEEPSSPPAIQPVSPNTETQDIYAGKGVSVVTTLFSSLLL